MAWIIDNVAMESVQPSFRSTDPITALGTEHYRLTRTPTFRDSYDGADYINHFFHIKRGLFSESLQLP